MALGTATIIGLALLAGAAGNKTGKVVLKKLAKEKMAWLEQFMPAAERVCAQYGVPPQVCVAQAALESGWGKKAGGFNYFGMKGSGSAGSQSWATQEVKQGQKVAVTSKFAKFSSMDDALHAYCKMLTQNTNFKPAMERFSKDPARFVTWLWGMGYATALDYPHTLIGVMRTIYRATGNPTYDVHADPKLEYAIKQIRNAKVNEKNAEMGKQRRQLTQVLLSPGGAGMAGTMLAPSRYGGIPGMNVGPGGWGGMTQPLVDCERRGSAASRGEVYWRGMSGNVFPISAGAAMPLNLGLHGNVYPISAGNAIPLNLGLAGSVPVGEDALAQGPAQWLWWAVPAGAVIWYFWTQRDRGVA